MKQLSVLLIAGVLALPAYAQNGFYISPSIGAGRSGSDQSVYTLGTDGQESASHMAPIFSYNIQFGVGYQYKNWRFQSGLQYFKSGYKVDNLIFGSGFNPNLPGATTTGSYKLSINQVGIPLQISYAIPLSRKLSLVPSVGFVAAYSFSGSSRLDEGDGGRKALSGADLNGYGRFTFWGQAGLQLEYKLNNRISLYGGPSVQYMLGTTGNDYSKNFHNINFNLGLKISLKKTAK